MTAVHNHILSPIQEDRSTIIGDGRAGSGSTESGRVLPSASSHGLYFWGQILECLSGWLSGSGVFYGSNLGHNGGVSGRVQQAEGKLFAGDMVTQ